jgi:YegS/Rv2252/BmrU family lipid kinase
MSHHVIIVNPNSGSVRREASLLSVIEHQFALRGHTVSVLETERKGHAAELAVQHAILGVSTLVAVGGDGTVSEVASGLLGSTVALGIIPVGSGNGLARCLDIPMDIPGAIDRITAGSVRALDVGWINDCPFFGTAGFGLDVAIVDRFNKGSVRGLVTYVHLAADALRSSPVQQFRLNGVPRHGAMLTFANASQFGNNAKIAPRAIPFDGVLHAVITPKLTRWNTVPLLVRMFAGRYTNSPKVQELLGTKFLVEFDQPQAFHTDGEVHAPVATAKISITNGQLRILC